MSYTYYGRTYYGRTYYGRTYYGLHLLRGVLLQRVRLAALHAVEGRLGLARPEELRAHLSRVGARGRGGVRGRVRG